MSWKLSIIGISAFFVLVACNGQGEKKSEQIKKMTIMK